ncbi:rhodanese-like domain-containing protein [Patescibacteria group bacterium]|jgi:rhodanese-related sulfurtransferase|nr:rhodanese-like domain-containing protein [Patescibacteria group bacterium]
MKATELKTKLQNNEVKVLDVREQEEFDLSGAIPGSENVPMGKVFVEASKGLLPKDKKIVTVCKSGTRCEIVARELKQKGYDIEFLEGGLDAWNAEKGE